MKRNKNFKNLFQFLNDKEYKYCKYIKIVQSRKENKQTKYWNIKTIILFP